MIIGFKINWIIIVCHAWFKTGSALIRVGQTEQALGEIEREYIRHAHDGICGPLSRFLEGEMRNITRERKVRGHYVMDKMPVQYVQHDKLLFIAPLFV